MTAKSLQTPTILGVHGSTIRIKHPDVSNYTRTFLASAIAAAGTAMSVYDNDNIVQNDWILIGEIGDEKTEECMVNAAVSRGSALTVTNVLGFAHELDSPVTRIFERKLAIYGAATDGGALTEIVGPVGGDSIDITWGKDFTEYTLLSTDTAYAYYVAKFYDGTTESSASDYIISTGLASNSVQKMVENAIDLTGARIDSEDITWDFLIRCAQDAQNTITQYINPGNSVKKDWSWETIEDTTSITTDELEDRYALSSLSSEMKYVDTKQSILNVRFGTKVLKYVPIDEFDVYRENKTRTEVATQAVVGATSLVVDDTSEFNDSGTLNAPSGQTLTYTAKDDSTNTFSGIPASGTGSITTQLEVDDVIWQNESGGEPSYYTVFDGNIYLDRPPSTTYDGYNLKFRYLKKIPVLTEVSSSTEIPFHNIIQYYIAWKIEMRRKNFDQADYFKTHFDTVLLHNAMSDKTYTMDTMSYYNYSEDDTLWESNRTWSNS